MKTNLDLADTFRTTNTFDENNQKRGQIHHKQDSETAVIQLCRLGMTPLLSKHY